MNKRILLITFLVVLALAMAACGGDDSDKGTERPTVRLKIGDQVFEQDIYSYCWPLSADNWECDVNEAAQENPTLAAVTAGEPVTFVVEDSQGTIKSFTATLLDGQGGMQDLGTGTEGVYTPELSDGRYRVRVNVEYADVEGVTIEGGDTPYVSYVFGLDVSGMTVAMEPTATPTLLPTETLVPPTNTQEPLPTNTVEPTALPEPTEEPAEAMTEEPAEAPVEATTEEPVEAAAAVPTEEPAEMPSEQPAEEPVEAAGEEPAEAAAAVPTAETAEMPAEEPAEQPAEAAGEEPAEAAPVPTEETAAMPVEEPAGEPAEAVTEEPAEAAAVPTEETAEMPTEEPVDEPAESAGEEPAEAVGEPAETGAAEPQAEEGALEPTPEGTPEVMGDLGEIAFAGTVMTEVDGSPVPVAGAQVSYTLVSTAKPENSGFGTTVTNARGQYSFAPVPIHDTDAITLRVDMRGYDGQIVDSTGFEMAANGGIFDTVIVRQPGTAAPEVEPPPAEAAAAEGGPTLNELPALTLVYGGRVYRPVGFQLCEVAASGESLCVEQPVTGVTQDRLGLLRGTDGELISSGEQPQEVRIEYLTDSGIATGQPETRRGDNRTLFTITPEPGDYIMSIRLTWAARNATYFFRITVSD